MKSANREGAMMVWPPRHIKGATMTHIFLVVDKYDYLDIIGGNKTRQGSTLRCTLKTAGCFKKGKSI
jgi:hypothetical protein